MPIRASRPPPPSPAASGPSLPSAPSPLMGAPLRRARFMPCTGMRGAHRCAAPAAAPLRAPLPKPARSQGTGRGPRGEDPRRVRTIRLGGVKSPGGAGEAKMPWRASGGPPGSGRTSRRAPRQGRVEKVPALPGIPRRPFRPPPAGRTAHSAPQKTCSVRGRITRGASTSKGTATWGAPPLRRPWQGADRRATRQWPAAGRTWPKSATGP